jgi:hypothetical protein
MEEVLLDESLVRRQPTSHHPSPFVFPSRVSRHEAPPVYKISNDFRCLRSIKANQASPVTCSVPSRWCLGDVFSSEATCRFVNKLNWYGACTVDNRVFEKKTQSIHYSLICTLVFVSANRIQPRARTCVCVCVIE